MKRWQSIVTCGTALLLSGVNTAVGQAPVTTAFSYQGQLNEDGQPAEGRYDFVFRLFDEESRGTQIGTDVAINDWTVVNGLFTVQLDFGSDGFRGDSRWLEIGVRPGSSTDPHVILAPRQPLTAVPYAMYSLAGPGAGGFWAADGDNITNTNSGFVGIGRSTPVSSSEYFGVLAPVASGYGGMYIRAESGNALPFYGYSVGSRSAWHYLDGPTGKWYLHNGGPRITVESDTGHVGIGTTDPDSPLTVTGSADKGINSVNTSGASGSSAVYGETAAANGYGVHGVATAESGNAVGVRGESVSGGGYGVHGRNTHPGGNFAYGVYGEVEGTLARGVYGVARAETGANYGVYGRSDSVDGRGVYGVHNADTGTAAGVHGVSDSTSDNAAGVRGELTAGTPGTDAAAVTGEVSSGGDTGYGVKGMHAGFGAGVFGTSNVGPGVTGKGVLGPGVYAEGNANDTFDGYALYATNTNSAGTVIYATSNSVTTNTILVNEGSGSLLRAYNGPVAPANLVFEIENDGETTVKALEITGGADLSERFDVAAPSGAAQKGMIVCIDPQKAGQLVLSTRPYDRTVAGVISGAGGVDVGMVMGQRDSVADGAHPVALTGRVWAWCDASNGPIRPGDLLTTSDRPGHAMKVTDHAEALGAIIGKAMTSLDEGTGLVLVLVSLQ